MLVRQIVFLPDRGNKSNIHHEISGIMSDVGDDGYTLNGKKFAVCMVVDVSGSMTPYVNELSESFNNFINEAKEDDDIRNTMDIALLTFSSSVVDEFEGFSDIKG